jgi:presenilin-like A22 family membrane protease
MNLLVRLIGMFLIAQLLGIYAGSYIIEDAKTNEVVSYMMIEEAGPETIPWFVFAVLFGAGIFLVITRLKIPFLFTLLEIAVISATSSILFYSFIKPILGLTIESMALAILLGFSLAIAKQFFPNLKNLAALLGSAGAGAVFGFTFGFVAAMIFLLVLAIYDYISVYKTKHMVTMANEIVKRNMAFTISAKEKLPSGKESRLDLGTGDLSLPIMAEVSAYSISPLLSAWALAGALAGVGIVLFTVWKKKQILPALPPIALGILLFTLFALLMGLY